MKGLDIGRLPLAWLEKLPNNPQLLLAVSGGADSVFLTEVMLYLSHKRSFSLAIAHVNHQTRESDSDEDESFVRKMAEKHSLPFYCQRISFEALETTARKANEADLRSARISILRALALAVGAQAILTGHHQDDLAETFLLMALRGSGPAGLGSLQTIRSLDDDLYLIRPLLNFRREEIRQVLKSNDIDWREDDSNNSKRFRRNRLRNEIFPALAAIEPAVVENFARSATFSNSLNEAFETSLKLQKFLNLIHEDSHSFSRLYSRQGLKQFSGEFLSEFLRRELHGFLQEHSGQYHQFPLPRAFIEQVVASLLSSNTDERTFDFQRKLRLYLDSKILFVVTNDMMFESAFQPYAEKKGWVFYREPEQENPFQLSVDDSVDFFELGITLKVTKDSTFGIPVSSEILNRKLHFRPANRKDVIKIPQGSKSIQELLREAGVPRFFRDQIAILWAGQEPVWIPSIWMKESDSLKKSFYLQVSALNGE